MALFHAILSTEIELQYFQNNSKRLRRAVRKNGSSKKKDFGNAKKS